jgi:hypothetical protein
MNRVVNSNYGQTNTEIVVHSNGEIVSDNMVQNNNFFEINFLDYIAKNYNNQTGILVLILVIILFFLQNF